MTKILKTMLHYKLHSHSNNKLVGSKKKKISYAIKTDCHVATGRGHPEPLPSFAPIGSANQMA
jgi:hypothetical protein